MLDLITEIAQETHILSLNAAIEAAAAGDHGRRFSVVAEEVRRLAQRSQESVDSVRNLLDEFAGSIRATVVATEEGSKEASRVLERAPRRGRGHRGRCAAPRATRARVAREISLATQQQNAASDEVVLTLKEVSQVVQRMADGLKQFSDTADRLNQLGPDHPDARPVLPPRLAALAQAHWPRPGRARSGAGSATGRRSSGCSRTWSTGSPTSSASTSSTARRSQAALAVNRQPRGRPRGAAGGQGRRGLRRAPLVQGGGRARSTPS